MIEIRKAKNGKVMIECSLESLSYLKRGVAGDSTHIGPDGAVFMLLEAALRNAEIVGQFAHQTGYHFEGNEVREGVKVKTDE